MDVILPKHSLYRLRTRRWYAVCIRSVCALTLSGAISAAAQSLSDFSTALPLERGGTLVLGILGGWKRWDSPGHPVRRTALELRSLRLPGVAVETAENHRLDVAHDLVLRAFDLDRSGRLDPPEAAEARLILYGQSLGGRATLRLCRRLSAHGIPVRLAVVIDAWGRDPYTVPPNVEAAANLFQRDFGFIRGASEIRPVDPYRTRLLGTWRYTYKHRDLAIPETNPVERWFFGSHLKMEHDPEPWRRVRDLLVNACLEP